jgi:hypothetical protein
LLFISCFFLLLFTFRQVPDLKLDNGYGNDAKTKWLFISGELDRNTPILFTYEIVKNFANSAHYVIKNGGHTVGMKLVHKLISNKLISNKLITVNLNLFRIFTIL